MSELFHIYGKGGGILKEVQNSLILLPSTVAHVTDDYSISHILKLTQIVTKRYNCSSNNNDRNYFTFLQIKNFFAVFAAKNSVKTGKSSKSVTKTSISMMPHITNLTPFQNGTSSQRQVM